MREDGRCGIKGIKMRLRITKKVCKRLLESPHEDGFVGRGVLGGDADVILCTNSAVTTDLQRWEEGEGEGEEEKDM